MTLSTNLQKPILRQFLVCCLVIVCGLVSSRIAFCAGHMGHTSVKNSWGLPGDLLLFPDLTVMGRIDQAGDKRLANSEVIPEFNLFFTADYQQFRFLGEWLLSTKTHNMERLQFGLHLGESSLWLGRFHNPIGYWNMQFHHAAILQTSVSRPGIMAFETSGGIIPNHLTGFLFEGIHELGQAGLYYTLGVGAGPDLNNGLSAFNIFEPGGSHRPGVTLRIGYQPISYGEDELGFSAAYTELPGDRSRFTQVKQVVTSLYGVKRFNDVQLLSEVVYVNNWLDQFQGGQLSSDFVNAYTQAAWNYDSKWTAYARIEGTLNKRNDPYLTMFPNYIEDRLLGGIRYNVNCNMALKLEASQDHLKGNHFGQIMFQWSAMFP